MLRAGCPYKFWDDLKKRYNVDGGLAGGWDIIVSRDVVAAIAANSTYVLDTYMEILEDFALGVYIERDLGVPFVANTATFITSLKSTYKDEDINLVYGIVEAIKVPNGA